MMLYVGLVMASMTAQAEQVYIGRHINYISGNELHRRCEAENGFDQTICTGYISGAVDMLQLAHGMNKDVSVCLPEGPGAELGQLADVVRRYLAAHPELRHMGASSLIFAALRVSFPCR